MLAIGLMGAMYPFAERVRCYADQRARERALLARRYGDARALLITLVWPTVSTQYERVDNCVSRGTDEDVVTFKHSVTEECYMTSVAGAILAQVAITALSLQSLSSTHWVARACFLIAVVAGCMSVYFACRVQRVVGRLYNAEMIKDWLMTAPVPKNQRGQHDRHRDDDTPSFAAVLTISAPFALVTHSIFALLTGLAVYFGFMFARRLDNHALNVFIALMVWMGTYLVLFVFLHLAQDAGSDVRGWQPGDVAASDDEKGEVRVADVSNASKVCQSLNHREPKATEYEAQTSQTADIISALTEAANAHRRSAAADEAVARLYAALIDPKPPP